MKVQRGSRSLELLLLVAVATLLSLAIPVAVALPTPDPTPRPSGGPTTTGAVPAPYLAPLPSRMGFVPAFAAGAIGSTPASGYETVALTLWPTDPAFFLNPGPNTPPMTVSEIGARYGLPPAQYSALQAYFLGQGLSIVHAWPDRLSLTVGGPASAMGAAFRTTERSGTFEGRTATFPATVPSLPTPFAAEVAAVTGLSSDLSTFQVPFVPLPGPTAALSSDASPAQGRTTTLVRAPAVHLIYGLDSLYNYSGTPHWATGIGIALLLWGSGYDPSDITTFFQNDYPSQLPVPTVRYYPVDGAPAPSAAALNDPSTGPQELTLDIEWSGSEAPGATLDAVYAPDGPASNGYSPTDPSMIDAVNEVVNSIAGVRVLSMSFGTNDAADSSFQTAFSSAFRQATLEGITILGASGDNGGTTGKGCQGNTAPQFPSTSPMVVSVGGTAPVLSEDSLGTVTGLDSEPAWDRAGGGFSATYAAPSWQLVGSAAGPIRASGMRGGPDVAGPASDNAFLFHGGDTFGMGTSFATPMWAGLIAEMDAVRGKPMGFVTPHLYAVGAQEAGTGSGGLVDITAGGNCLGPAGPGWDTTTGWGSPRALPLFESVAGTFIAVSLNASPQPVAPGATLTSTIRAVNATSGAAISSLSVYLEIDSSGYSGPCGGTLASATGPTDANGTFSVGVPIPGCYFGTAVSLTVTVSGNGYYGSNQTIVSVNLAGLSGVLAGLQHYPYNVIGFVVIMAIATTVGLLISGRRRRRIRARRGPPPTPPPTAIASPAVGPPPRSPAPPPPPVAPAALEPSPSLLVAGTSDPSEPASVAVAAPALAGSPASGAASCDACGASVLSASVTCPSCGAPLGD